MEGVFGGGTIDKGVLACGKGNHGAGAWVARVRVSAHTVWMWSSFPLLHKLLMNHMIPMLRSLLKGHSFLTMYRSSQMKRCSSLMRRRNLPKCHMFPAVRSLLVRHRSGVLSMSLGVLGLSWRPVPVCWPMQVVEVVEGEGGWCRHTEGTDTVAGIVDTVDIDAFAGSTLCKTLQQDLTPQEHLWQPGALQVLQVE